VIDLIDVHDQAVP